MSTGQITNFYTHKPEGPAKQLVFLLHGLGSDGRDLFGLVPHFSPQLPQAVFVSPDAPFRCDMAPMGYQWFSLQEWTPESLLKGVQEAAPILSSFIAAQAKEHGVSYENIALVGFSQGTMMSLYMGPRLDQKIAGILGYSGALVWEEDVKPGQLHKMPVHLIHGEADDVVPVSAYHHARERLEAHEFSVSGYTQPGLAHGIDEPALKSGLEFLQNNLTLTNS